jgi:cyanophycin synthetase
MISRHLKCEIPKRSAEHSGMIFFIHDRKYAVMKVLDTKIMRGPNYWSNYHHRLIVTKVDIGELENFPTNKIKGFPERLENLMPSLYSHRCSKDYEGGFFERLREGTWIGHVIEHIALELQCIAGMECGFGRTRTAERNGIYYIVFSYQIEAAGVYASEAAIRIAEDLIAEKEHDINADIEILKSIKAKHGIGPSTQSIINEAIKRDIPFRSMEDGSLIMFGQGVNQKLIRASMTCGTSSFGVETACDKDDTKRVLSKAFIPVPKGKVIHDQEGLKNAIEEIGFPVVIKPINGNHGRGITTNISNIEQAIDAFALAQQISEDVIAEQYFEGDDYRLLVVNYKLIAAARRTPAFIIGDGKSSVKDLIDQTNADPRRGDGHEKVLTRIKIDAVTETILKKRDLSIDSILPIGEVLFVKDTANLSTGGTSTDVTDVVPPETKFVAERIACLMKLDICGIDVLAKDIRIPIDGKNGAIIEVNACPGFRMHLSPSKGIARNVAEPVMDMLYPAGKPARIPLVAVTGTNGKTTTTRLTAHIAKTAGFKVGYTTTDGIYIQDHLIHSGDCTGSVSAAAILTDPTVDFAVLECARGGILRSGLGFDHCDISIITNVSEDHLGLTGIQTLKQMARVKEVVAQSTFDHGYSILNADDDLVYSMRADLDCNIALFSIDPTNERIYRHTENGGLAAIVEKGYLTICKGEWKIRICKITAIPLTIGGKAECMIKNVLPAALVAIIQNFKIEDIRNALLSFIPSPEFTPGRMNLFSFRTFDFMIDYAHNTGGFRELKTFLERVESPQKIGIITGVGDRRDEDIRALGELSGEMFDEVIIRHDEDLRGRTQTELTDLLVEGIHETHPDMKITVVSKELESIQYAMENCEKGAFIVLCTDAVQSSISYLKKKQKEEKETFEILDSILAQNK